MWAGECGALQKRSAITQPTYCNAAPSELGEGGTVAGWVLVKMCLAQDEVYAVEEPAADLDHEQYAALSTLFQAMDVNQV